MLLVRAALSRISNSTRQGVEDPPPGLVADDVRSVDDVGDGLPGDLGVPGDVGQGFPRDRDHGLRGFTRASKMLEFYSQLVGPYPYEKMSFVQSSTRFGGMENASNIFYHEGAVTGERGRGCGVASLHDEERLADSSRVVQRRRAFEECGNLRHAFVAGG